MNSMTFAKKDKSIRGINAAMILCSLHIYIYNFPFSIMHVIFVTCGKKQWFQWFQWFLEIFIWFYDVLTSLTINFFHVLNKLNVMLNNKSNAIFLLNIWVSQRQLTLIYLNNKKKKFWLSFKIGINESSKNKIEFSIFFENML